ncbi:hypothetical protein KCU99_g10158, partial [Aureobasidium melanogenum]
MTSISLPFSLLADAMACGVPDAVHMTHDSQPVLKSYMKVNDQLRAFSVTQPSLRRIFRSNQPLATLSSYLDNVHRQHVILKLAAFNNFTTLNAYLSGTATHNKSQYFDLVDAGPAPTFCTLYSLCLGHVSAEPTRSGAPSTLPSLSPRRLVDTPNTSSALHCLKLLSTITVLDHIIVSGPWHLNKRCLVLMTALLKALANVKVYQAAGAWDIDRLMVEAAQRFGGYVSGAFDGDDFRKFVEAVFNSVVGPAKLLYDHLVKECFTVTLYADNRLVYISLSQKFNSQNMRICKGRNKAADLSIMPTVNTAEEALMCTAAVCDPLKQLPQSTAQDDISPLLKRTQYEYEAQMARPPQRQDKLVQLYSIVLLDTIDVDILEHLERCTTAMAEYQHSNIGKELVPGTNFKAKNGQELVKPQRTQLIRDVNGEYKLVPRQMLLAAGGEGQFTQTRDAVSAKEEQIKILEQDIAELSADKNAVIDKLELQLDQKEENDEKVNDLKRALDDANKRNAQLIHQINSQRAGQPDNTAFLLERNEALENAKKLQSSLTASEEKVKKLEAQQSVIVNTAFISQPVANGTAWDNPTTPTLAGVGVTGLSWVGDWLGWEVQTSESRDLPVCSLDKTSQTREPSYLSLVMASVPKVASSDAPNPSENTPSEAECRQESSKAASKALELEKQAKELTEAAAGAGDPDERQKLLNEALSKSVEAQSFGKVAKYLRSGAFQGLLAGGGVGTGVGAGLGALTGTLVGGVSSLALGGLLGGIGSAVGALHGPWAKPEEIIGKGVQKLSGMIPGWKATDDQKSQLEKMFGQVNEQERPTEKELEDMTSS